MSVTENLSSFNPANLQDGAPPPPSPNRGAETRGPSPRPGSHALGSGGPFHTRLAWKVKGQVRTGGKGPLTPLSSPPEVPGPSAVLSRTLPQAGPEGTGLLGDSPFPCSSHEGQGSLEPFPQRKGGLWAKVAQPSACQPVFLQNHRYCPVSSPCVGLALVIISMTAFSVPWMSGRRLREAEGLSRGPSPPQ